MIDVDITKLSASMTGDTLTVNAPKKVETPKALEEEKMEQIEIHYEEPKAALEETTVEEEAQAEAADKAEQA